MSQVYHANAKTNSHIRSAINTSDLPLNKLSEKYNISLPTVRKWKRREILTDRSSVPKNIKYTLSDIQQSILVALRKSTWLPLDEITEQFFAENPNKYRSAVYRTFVRNNVNKVPQKIKEKAKKFKEYAPGYLHIDVTYLPRIKDKKYYLFVAIDRATRLLYYRIYEEKSSTNAKDFVQKCLNFFPFKITHILTDNGLEFTNRLLKSKKGEACKTKSKFTTYCENKEVEHRLTRPFTPKTNGMVEKANDIIKSKTIKIHTYTNLVDMDIDLYKFLFNYNVYRRHGSLRKELNVKTPFDAVSKWYELDPALFTKQPAEFFAELENIASVLSLNQKQCCET
ncbi:MAG: DDE-type integrase/transposase/recombinase [Tenacibaculum sp.]